MMPEQYMGNMSQHYEQDTVLDLTTQTQYVNQVMIGQNDHMSHCRDLGSVGSVSGIGSVGGPEAFLSMADIDEFIQEDMQKMSSRIDSDRDSGRFSPDTQSGFASSDESCGPPSPPNQSPLLSSGSMVNIFPSIQRTPFQGHHQEALHSPESNYQTPMEESSYSITADPLFNPPFCDINEIGSWMEPALPERPRPVHDYPLLSFPTSQEVVGLTSAQKDRKWTMHQSEERCVDYGDDQFSMEHLSSPESPLSEDEGFPEPVDTRQQIRPPTARRRNRSSESGEKVGRKGLQLWQFLLEVLRDERYNPDLIRWVDVERGTFKFIQSQKVAKLWGQKRAKNNMSYEYLSRALRYYYSRGIMSRIPGKRLVYQFGPNAYGWRNSEMSRHGLYKQG